MQGVKRTLGRHWPIILLILVNLVIGVAIVRDYGLSWDEPNIYKYARHSVNNYYNLFRGMPVTPYANGNLDLYGPVFFILARLFSRFVTMLLPNWSEINGWHLAYFLVFQLGVVSLYFLVHRWTGIWAAFGAALLFSTQPLLWGHAFINPKDIPFMAFFLASVSSGLYMVDSVLPLSFGTQEAKRDLVLTFQAEWNGSALKAKKRILAFWVVFILSILFMVTGLSQRLVAAMVTTAYQADKQTLIGAWFNRIALNAGQLAVGNYIHKAQVLFSYVEIVYVMIFVFIGVLIFNRSFPLTYENGIKAYLAPYIKRVVLNPLVLAAGFLLGATASIRVIGPLAGGIVILYGLYKSWRKSLLFIPPYFLIAGLTTYLTWPYLWGNAINHFIESLATMSDYPWEGFVFFQGKLLSQNEIPRYYLPYLMSIQLTEIVLILFVFGLFISIWRAFKQKQVEPFVLFVIWFVLPVFIVVAGNSIVYNNFRQFLFVLPPIFLMGGLALDSLFMKVRGVIFRAAILFLFALPAVYMDVQLHPYQYIYYNSFVGGVQGAFHKYDLDYWGTSIYETSEYINRVAPPGAKVFVLGPVHIFRNYARPDLVINSGERYDYVIINGRQIEDQTACRNVDAVKTIERDGAVLTEVKIPPLSGEKCP